MPKSDFKVGNKQPICFSLNVIATDLPIDHKDFQAKIVFDSIPAFVAEAERHSTQFNANRVHELLNFVSDRLIKKVIESVYYDRGNKDTCKPKELPPRYDAAMKIYNERLREKKKARKGDSSYLDIKEHRSKAWKKNGTPQNCIEDIVDEFFKTSKRPVWEEEKNVTRVIWEQLSPPSLTVETRTVVNGDKKPK